METIREYRKWFTETLAALYPPTEARSITKQVFQEVLQKNAADLVLHPEEIVGLAESGKLLSMLERLKNYEPVQYVLGYTFFHGMKLAVTPDVLIPRPETEEMVAEIIGRYNGQPISLVDIGTGSGCIPIAIKRAIPVAEVHALDVSAGALKIAALNANQNGVNIIFHQEDILDTASLSRLPQFDLIVSNPPYVTEAEKKQLQPNVTEYEPRLALFVPNEDPFLFYKAIYLFAETHLAPGGEIWFEINEFLAEDLAQELQQSFQPEALEIRKDLSRKQRFLILRK